MNFTAIFVHFLCFLTKKLIFVLLENNQKGTSNKTPINERFLAFFDGFNHFLVKNEKKKQKKAFKKSYFYKNLKNQQIY